MTTSTHTISVIGLGYVGLPVAVAFALGGYDVIAFDINEQRIRELRDNHDRTGEVEHHDLRRAKMVVTSDPADLARANFHIVTVPTPITEARLPDLGPLFAASRTVGCALKPGDIVVYESTVYPGATEEDCVPVLEEASGLTFGRDFAVGYSPERINPGDREHRFTSINKVVSGSDAETLETIANVYGSVIEAHIHKSPSLKAAEAAKVIENTQRDLNIALMNELAMIFHRLGIDTRDVLAASATKWNFLKFTPGLVGGHCIGVDPYYLTHRAERAGYHPQVILAGRRINHDLGAYVARQVVRHLLQARRNGKPVVTVLGLTFKEDVPDIRNTKVTDIVSELESFGCVVQVHDPMADAGETEVEYGISLTSISDLKPADAVVLAVGHRIYRDGGWEVITPLLQDGRGMVADVKGVLDRATRPEDITLWRL